MQLHKRPAHSYENVYNGIHCVQLYEDELPDNVGEWIEQTGERYYDQAAAFFDSAISSIANGFSASSRMANGDEITHTVGLSTPTSVTPNRSTVSADSDSVIVTTNLSTPNYMGFGASYTIRQAIAISDTTSGDDD